MKVKEFHSIEQLDELNLKQAATAGLIGLTALSPRTGMTHEPPKSPPAVVQPAKDEATQVLELVNRIASDYKINKAVANHIVNMAYKHAQPDFPKAKDLLAIIGAESDFQHAARSRLKADPALGLMQIRPGVWKIPPKELMNIDKNIEHGAKILNRYYNQLKKNKAAAIQAYNLGLTDFLKGKRNHSYLNKVKAEYQWLVGQKERPPK